MRRDALVGLLLAAGIALPLRAAQAGAYQDGNKLLELCTTRDNIENGFCIGYVMGVADVLNRGQLSGFDACLPETVSATEATHVVVRYLRTHPENRYLTGEGLVAEALAQAFSCK